MRFQASVYDGGVSDPDSGGARDRWEAEMLARADQQTAVAVLGREAHTIPLPELLEEAVQTVSRVLPCDLAGVLKLAPGHDHLRMAAVVGGLSRDTIETLAIPTGSNSHAGCALQRRETIVCSNYGDERRFSAAPEIRAAGMCSGLATPIVGAGQFGVLVAYTRDPREFSDDEIHFMQAVGTVLAAAFARDTAQKLDRDLQIAQRLDSIGQMAGGIAHDFNNLLGVILNYSQFALDELDPGSQAHSDVTEAIRAAQRAADLTRQLLMFSRTDNSAAEVLDVHGALSDLSSLLRRTLGEHINLKLRLAEGAPSVAINSAQFERVIVNLAVNARDAMSGGGALTIETAEVELTEPLPSAPQELPPGRYLRMTISDTGHGMSREVVDLAFEPFFTTKERGRGTGLGLATVYGLVTSAGGHIRLYSEVGIGTTVRIYLPTASEGPTAPGGEPAGAPSGHGQRILVVEDEKGVRALTERILSAAGYEVVSAASASAALLVLHEREDDIDLVLSDVVMPGMSGAELAGVVRARRPGATVLFMSGYTGDVLSHQGLSREDVSVVEKPFTAGELLEAVDSALQRRSGVSR